VSGLQPATVGWLTAAGLDPARVLQVVTDAVAEDLAYGPDVTTHAVVGAGAVGSGDVVPRGAGVLAGLPVAAAVLDVVGAGRVAVTLHFRDCDRAEPGVPALTARGPLRSLLTAERTLLNLLGRLSGIATLTHAWVRAVDGTGVGIRDTRKTTPGLRMLEKYAVRCGGGRNHRMGLGDEALVKDNHVLAAGTLSAAVEAVRRAAPQVPLQVECDTAAQVHEALAAGVTSLLLDNMSLIDLRAAVAAAARVGGVRLEASGGLTLDRAREVAATGVHDLAVGALTHSAPALDVGFDVVQAR
jgi:nicotinate-nucleotide pyrophosphorylase (carboxylating)